MNGLYTMAFLTIFDTMVGAATLYVMFKWYREKQILPRAGISLMFLGCVYQALQSGYFVISGRMPLYTDYPLWMMKDIGFGVVLLGYIIDKRTRKPK